MIRVLSIVLGWILIVLLTFEPFTTYSNLIGSFGVTLVVGGTLKK